MAEKKKPISLEALTDDATSGRLTSTRRKKYFAIDPDRSSPYYLVFKLKPKAAVLFEESLGSEQIRHVLQLAYASEGAERSASAAAGHGAARTKILTEGDSWFKLPDIIGNYPADVVDFLSKEFDVRPLAMWGDTLENIVRNPSYRQILDSGLYKHFLLSAGGNDILGSISKYVTRCRPGDTSPDDGPSYIKPSFGRKIGDMMKSFEAIVADTKAIGGGGITLYVHGYGDAIPRKGGAYLGEPFEALGFDLDRIGPLTSAIVKEMVAVFNRGLKTFAASHAGVVYLDLRPILKEGDWHRDEIHPSASGARKIAKAFGDAIRRNGG